VKFADRYKLPAVYPERFLLSNVRYWHLADCRVAAHVRSWKRTSLTSQNVRHRPMSDIGQHLLFAEAKWPPRAHFAFATIPNPGLWGANATARCHQGHSRLWQSTIPALAQGQPNRLRSAFLTQPRRLFSATEYRVHAAAARLERASKSYN
jgi:hypothetical protein